MEQIDYICARLPANFMVAIKSSWFTGGGQRLLVRAGEKAGAVLRFTLIFCGLRDFSERVPICAMDFLIL